MIRVALVEDEESSQRTLTEYLERFSQEINEKIHVSIFPDGAEIVEDYRGNYDIILMDILMRYMDGMEAASEIGKVDKEVVILFITSTPAGDLRHEGLHGGRAGLCARARELLRYFRSGCSAPWSA